jgi:LemA protein
MGLNRIVMIDIDRRVAAGAPLSRAYRASIGAAAGPRGVAAGRLRRALDRLRAVPLLAVLAVMLAGCGVNTIPTLEEQAKAQWSQVQNQYQRRAELIPNLVETVRGYAKQERDTLTQVIEARAKATQVQVSADQLTDPEALRRFQEAQGQLSGALGRLIAVSENYPDLKSNQNFLALQSQLEGTENRIAVARRDYIQAVQAYNTETRTFPGRLWAMVYGAKPMATFSTTEENQRAPQVKF